MATVSTLPDSISYFDLCLRGRCNDTRNTDKLRNLITLKSAQLRGYFISNHLNLKFGAFFHFNIIWLKNFGIVNNLGCALESFHQFTGSILEFLDEPIIKCLQLCHINLKEVIASLSIISQLFSININVVLLRFPDKVHELVLGVMLIQSIIVMLYFVVDQVLICVINSFSFKCVHFSIVGLFSQIFKFKYKREECI